MIILKIASISKNKEIAWFIATSNEFNINHINLCIL